MEANRQIPPEYRLRHPLVGVLLPVVCGIICDKCWDLSLQIWGLAALIFWLVWWCVRSWERRKFQATDGQGPGANLGKSPDSGGEPQGSVHRRLHQSRWGIVQLLLFFLAAASISGMWHQFRWNRFVENEIGLRAPEVSVPVAMKLCALESPKYVVPESNPLHAKPTDDYSVFRCKALAVRDGKEWIPATGALRVRVVGQLEGIDGGDQLEVFGKLNRPSPAMNPGDFSGFDYQRRERRLATLQVNHIPSIHVVARSSNWNPRYWIARLRRVGRKSLWRYLPADQAELAAALLLGERDYLDRERTDAFFHTGTIHLLAISGLHVGILAMGFYFLSRTPFVPTNVALALAMAFTLLYAGISGGRPPVIRATILVWVVCGGAILHRDAPSFNSLAAAALVVLVLNPAELFSTAAQLSFVAVGTMIWYVPILTQPKEMTPLDRLIARQRSYAEVLLRIVAMKVWRVVLASLLIWSITLPLVSSRFHLVSPSALFLNAFLWVPLSIGLFFGFGVLLFGGIVPPLAKFCAMVCSASLSSMEWCVTGIEGLPGSHFWVAGAPGFAVFAFYLVLIVCAAIPLVHRWWPLWTVAAFAIFGVGWAANASSAIGEEELQVHFLSVGHGTSTVVQFPGGDVWIYDAGSLNSSRSATNAISAFLWEKGITRIDALVMSHADVDHFNAAPGLLERFRVGQVIFGPRMFLGGDSSLDVLESSIDRVDVKRRQLVAGDGFQNHGVTVRVLHPVKSAVTSSDNANSLVLHLEYLGRQILLTGDIEEDGLLALLEQPSIDVDLAMAPHHGSIRSQPKLFCEWSRPEWIVVSGAKSSTVNEGVVMYQDVGCNVLHTADVGCVSVSVRGGELDVSTHLESGTGQGSSRVRGSKVSPVVITR